MAVEWIGWLYALTVLALAGFGLHLLAAWVVAAGAALRAAGGREPAAPAPAAWPVVLVQLPIYNERYVVERAIDAAAALQYPAGRLLLQVLDDSTDETAALARARVAAHRARGAAITYLHRRDRTGFKAGALAAGLAAAPEAELVAVFDADFVPPPDFLRRLVPDFQAAPRLGLVQARWEHLNPDDNALTAAQALAYDSYFSVEQPARSQAGWLMNFNGSAGLWRRRCIEAAGGWQGDTLAEDLDLSYRAQLSGWRLAYRLDVAAPAELPAGLLAIKRQQFRWAKGSFQVLRKLGGALLRSAQPVHRKLLGLLHLAGYLPHPLVVLSLLLSLPVVLLHGWTPLRWELFGWLGLVSPALALWGQVRLRPAAPFRRLWAYPVLMVGLIGLALSNTVACAEALAGRTSVFMRTPKSAVNAADDYVLPLDWTTWGELVLALYALATALLALEWAPTLAPALFLYALGFGGVAARGLWEAWGQRSRAGAAQPERR